MSGNISITLCGEVLSLVWNSAGFDRAGYMTMDSATVASQNDACTYQCTTSQMQDVMILFCNCNCAIIKMKVSKGLMFEWYSEQN